MSSPDQTCAAIVDICQHLYQRGFIAGTEGNVSVRVDTNRIWITPSGYHKGMMHAEDLLLIDLEGQVHAGQGRPSSETPMHLALYQSRDDIQSVVHAHPPIATAMTVTGSPLATNLLPEAVVVLGDVPTVPYHIPSTWDFANMVGEAMQHTNAALLENHGAVAVGASLQSAFNVMETIERAAQIFSIAKTLGHVRPLSSEAIKALQALYAN
ncbi:class II aldolase/adducin family protein [Candidatus Entotheonella palauensis]|uniref:class II aldolase/adducin family protein n=1 Tax=Candidatus Entotheonella palauensis TaxID=93172 RepID=UPI0005551260|nr:class II aldolase/adducin family protein [Candidatus Entotheonella palauensis]